MSNFRVFRKPAINTKLVENFDNAIDPNFPLFRLVHINTWSKCAVRSLIVVLKFFDVKKDAEFAVFKTLILSPNF